MNVLKSEIINTIITLLNNGVSQREIFRRTGVDRKTIRKYSLLNAQIPQDDLNSNSSTPATGSEDTILQTPPPRPPAQNKLKEANQAKSACEPHREWIEQQVQLGRNGVSIYQDLVERYGFNHKYNSVKRFVRSLKLKEPKQFDRLEYPPGEEAQVDYGTGAKT
ncbi:MAG: hypothetical protein GY702_14040 [Desulfobulbaceae bacterium]|nr:hypothetical protein [Desulfobulbaceae bacterium]